MREVKIKPSDFENLNFQISIETPSLMKRDDFLEDKIEQISDLCAKLVDDAMKNELKKYPKQKWIIENISIRSIQKIAVKTTGLSLVRFDGNPLRAEIWKDGKMIKRIF